MIIKTDEMTTDIFDNDNSWYAVCDVTPTNKVKILKVYQENVEVEDVHLLPKSMHDSFKQMAIEINKGENNEL